jgi:hypothetical protein
MPILEVGGDGERELMDFDCLYISFLFFQFYNLFQNKLPKLPHVPIYYFMIRLL